MPSVLEALAKFCRTRLAPLLALLFIASLAPLPAEYLLGNQGEPYLAFISPLIVVIAAGLVCASWFVLILIMYPLGRVAGFLFGRYVYFLKRFS
jgi:hypothetical protein